MHYKGDWLRRPIASNEIPALVRATVWVSERLNRLVGLDQPWRGQEREEPPETVLHQGVAWLRRRGYRCERALSLLAAWRVRCTLVSPVGAGAASASWPRSQSPT